MDLRPDVVTVAVTRVDGGVTVLRIRACEYRAPDDDERGWGIVDRIAFNDRKVTPAVVEATIAKFVSSGTWGGERTGWKMPVSWRFVPNDYVEDADDHYFRNAWRDKDGAGKPDTDMAKARDIWRDTLRHHRANLFEDLDTEYMRADERADTAEKQRIAQQKQALRDVTADPAVDAATTPEELKEVWPTALGQRPLRVAGRNI